MAAYFGVTTDVVRQLSKRHREELEVNGMVVLRGADLRKFESDNVSLSLGGYPQARRSLTIYSRRAVLNIAMLLRDSDVARQVRVYLLDMEYLARTQPVENPAPTDVVSLDDRIDQRITHILGKTVVPMFNALIETSGEHRRELIALRTGVQRIEKRLQQHHARLQRLESPQEARPLAGVMAAMDAMNGREFEEHVATLLRRDGCTSVVVQGRGRNRGIDITARTADGRLLVVQCKRFAPHLSITSPEVQKFAGAAKVLHGSEVALFVATCPFTRDALNIAAESGITAVHPGQLEEWSSGEPLTVLN
ncbi:restriction endonuclease [Streptomyces sp. P17]|uniref:restriction endonuclease n=1 Tax=Streptomyces sp. P17 TaxID=3074716 RepID=UPI0028F41FA8|nr:restriction endonuclease [Streptomyces sp. P17]MDT9695526.1 restriction endonuclease [Streptomyces sp. P17]